MRVAGVRVLKKIRCDRGYNRRFQGGGIRGCTGSCGLKEEEGKGKGKAPGSRIQEVANEQGVAHARGDVEGRAPIGRGFID